MIANEICMVSLVDPKRQYFETYVLMVSLRPDAVSYIRKMEKERQARQHGAQQDNRSFVQKYVSRKIFWFFKEDTFKFRTVIFYSLFL